MRKINLSPKVQTNITTFTAIISGFMLVYVISLFILNMTYKKAATNVAGENYVSEVTKWPGHTHINHIGVEYE